MNPTHETTPSLVIVVVMSSERASHQVPVSQRPPKR